MPLSQEFMNAMAALDQKGDVSQLKELAGGEQNIQSGQSLVNEKREQKQEEKQEEEDNSIEGQLQKQKEEKEDSYQREMTGPDWLFGKIAQASEGIKGLAGMDSTMAHLQQEGVTPDNIGRLAYSLPMTMATMIPAAPMDMLTSGYEAITGKPVTESAGDKMANEDLNPQQRAAAGFEAGLMGAGMLTGGTGAGIKAAGELLKGGEEMGLQAAKAAGKAAWEAGGTGLKGFARDVGMSAGEGAAYGVAGAFRGDQDTYKDGNSPTGEDIMASAGQNAAMGGAMGALGKGFAMAKEKIMGGGNTPDNYSQNKDSAAQDNPDLDNSTMIEAKQKTPDANQIADEGMLDTVSKYYQDKLDDSQKQGSASSLVMVHDQNLNPGEAGITSGFAQAVMQNAKDSDRVEGKTRGEVAAQDIAKAFHIEDQADTLYKAAQNNDTKTITDTLNAGLEQAEANGDPVYMVVHKNPAGKTKSESRLQIRNVVDEKSKELRTDQTMAHMFGADFDGDEAAASFNPNRLENAEYLMDNIKDDANKMSKIEYDELGMGTSAFKDGDRVNVDKARDAYKSALKGIINPDEVNGQGKTFAEYVSENSRLTNNKDNVIDTIADKISKAYGDEEVTNDKGETSYVANNADYKISREIENATDLYKNWKAQTADGLDSNLAQQAALEFKSRLLGPNDGVSKYSSQIIGENTQSGSYGKIRNAFKNTEVDPSRNRIWAGKSTFDITMAAHLDRKGVLGDVTSKDLNDIFRMFGSVKYDQKSDDYIVFAKSVKDVTDWADFARFSFGLTIAGKDVSKMYKNARNTAVVNLFLRDHPEFSNDIIVDSSTNTCSIKPTANFDDMLKGLGETFNAVTKVEKQVLKKASNNKDFEIPFYDIYQIPTESEIKALSSGNVKAQLNVISKYIFCDDQNQFKFTSENYGTKTILEFAHDLSSEKYFKRNLETDYDQSAYSSQLTLGDIAETVATQLNNKKSATTKRSMDRITEIVNLLRKNSSLATEGGRDRVTGYKLKDLCNFSDSLVEMWDVKEAIWNGIIGQKSLLENEDFKGVWELFDKNTSSEDIANQIVQSIIQMKTKYHFADVQDNFIKASELIKQGNIESAYDALSLAINGDKEHNVVGIHQILNDSEKTGGNTYYETIGCAALEAFNNCEIDGQYNVRRMAELCETINPFIDNNKSLYEKLNILTTINNNGHEHFNRIDNDALIFDAMRGPDKTNEDYAITKKIIGSKEYVTNDDSFVEHAVKRNVGEKELIESTFREAGYTEQDTVKAIQNQLLNNSLDSVYTVTQDILNSASFFTNAIAEKAGANPEMIRYSSIQTAIRNLPQTVQRFLSIYTTGNGVELTEREFVSNELIQREILANPNRTVKIKMDNGQMKEYNQRTFIADILGKNPADISQPPSLQTYLDVMETRPELVDLLRPRTVSYSGPANAEGTKIVASKDPVSEVLLKSYQDYMQGGNAKLVENETKIIQANLMSHYDFFGIIANAFYAHDDPIYNPMEVNERSTKAVQSTRQWMDDVSKRAYALQLTAEKENMSDEWVSGEVDKLVREAIAPSAKREGEMLENMINNSPNPLSPKKSAEIAYADTFNELGMNTVQQAMESQLLPSLAARINANDELSEMTNVKFNTNTEIPKKEIEDVLYRVLSETYYKTEQFNILNRKYGLEVSDVGLFERAKRQLGINDDNIPYLADKLDFGAKEDGQPFTETERQNAVRKILKNDLLFDDLERIYTRIMNDDHFQLGQVTAQQLEKARSAKDILKIANKEMTMQWNTDQNIDITDPNLLSNGTKDLLAAFDDPRENVSVADIADALNVDAANARISSTNNLSRQTRISLDNKAKTENRVRSIIQASMDLYSDRLGKNRNNTDSINVNRFSSLSDEQINAMEGLIADWNSIKITSDNLDLFSNKGRLFSNVVVDELSSANVPTTVGVTGVAPARLGPLVFALNRLGNQNYKEIPINVKSKTMMPDLVRTILEEAFVPARDAQDGTYYGISDNEIAQFINNPESLLAESRFAEDPGRSIKINEATARAMGLDANAEWVPLTKENIVSLIDAYKETGPTDETLQFSTDFGRMPTDINEIIAYIMEPRILKSKKNVVADGTTFDKEKAYCVDYDQMSLSGKDVMNGIRNGKQLGQFLYEQAQDYAKRYQTAVRSALFESEIDGKAGAYPGYTSSDNGKFASVNSSFFDVLMPWISVETEDGRILRYSKKNLFERKGEMLDPATGEELDPRIIKEVRNDIQDPEILSQNMYDAAVRARTENPNITSEDIIKVWTDYYENPELFEVKGRTLNDMYNQYGSFLETKPSTNLSYIQGRTSLAELLYNEPLQSERKNFLFRGLHINRKQNSWGQSSEDIISGKDKSFSKQNANVIEVKKIKENIMPMEAYNVPVSTGRKKTLHDTKLSCILGTPEMYEFKSVAEGSIPSGLPRSISEMRSNNISGNLSLVYVSKDYIQKAAARGNGNDLLSLMKFAYQNDLTLYFEPDSFDYVKSAINNNKYFTVNMTNASVPLRSGLDGYVVRAGLISEHDSVGKIGRDAIQYGPKNKEQWQRTVYPDGVNLKVQSSDGDSIFDIIKNQGDASIYLTNHGRQNSKFNLSSRNTIDLPSHTEAKTNTVQILGKNKNERDVIKSWLSDKDSNVVVDDRYIKTEPQQSVVEDKDAVLRNFINTGRNVKDNADNNAVVTSRVTKGDCVGVVTFEDNNGVTHLCPVLAPNENTHGNIEVRLYRDPSVSQGNKVVIEAKGQRPLSNNDTFKYTSGTGQYKGMVSHIPGDIVAVDSDKPVAAIIDKKTIVGRTPDGSSARDLNTKGALLLNIAFDNKENFSFTDLMSDALSKYMDKHPEFVKEFGPNKEAVLMNFKTVSGDWVDNTPRHALWTKILDSQEILDLLSSNIKDANRKAEFQTSLKRTLSSFIGKGVDPLWVLDHDKMANFVAKGPTALWDFANLFGDQKTSSSDIYKIYWWLMGCDDSKIDFRYSDAVARKYDVNVPTDAPKFCEDMMRYVYSENGKTSKPMYLHTQWDIPSATHQNSAISLPSGDGKWDRAQRMNQYMLTGNGDAKDMMDLLSSKMQKDEPKVLYDFATRNLDSKELEYKPDMTTEFDPNNIDSRYFTHRYTYNTSGAKHLADFSQRQYEMFRDGKIKVWRDLSNPDNKDKTWSYKDNEMRLQLEEFLDALGVGARSDEDYRKASMIVACGTAGDTATTHADEHMKWDTFVDAAKRATDRVRNGKLPFAIGVDDDNWICTINGDQRSMLPITDPELLRWLARTNKFEQKSTTEIREFLTNNISKIEENTIKFNSDKKEKLALFGHALSYEKGRLGIPSWDDRCWYDKRWRDMASDAISCRTNGFGDNLGDIDVFTQMMKDKENRLKGAQIIAENRKNKVLKNEASRNGFYISKVENTDKQISNGFRTATMLSKGFGVMNPAILEQNVIDKFMGIKGQKLMMWVNGKLGGAKGFEVPDEVIKDIAHSQEANDFFDALHLSRFRGETERFKYMMANNQITAKEYIKACGADASKLNSIYNQVTRIGTGEPVMRYSRNELAIRLWLQTAEEDGLHYLGDTQTAAGPDGKPITANLITAFMGNSERSKEARLCDMFLGGDSLLGETDIVGEKAWNMALKGDMAQNNVVNWFLEHAISDRPLPDFLMTTLGNKYMRATMNTMGRTLNWFMPTSTLNHIAAKLLGESPMAFEVFKKISNIDPKTDSQYLKDYFKGEMEMVKGYNTIREALIADAMHMTAPMLATMLAGAAFFQPPEDDSKKQNYQEWTVCGLRIGQNWWLDDVLGIAAPLACFWKSSQMGNPDATIFIRGIQNHLANNPFLKIGDCISAVFETDHALDEAESIAAMYENAPQGAPSPVEYALASLPAVSMSYLSQFITPAFIKDIARTMNQYEVSYNKIYETDAAGNIIYDSDGTPKTQKTTFADAQIRKICRNNPILGTIMDLLPTGSKTSYVGANMPRQTYNDPAQMLFMKKYSILDSDGNDKSQKEKEQVAAAILTMLASTDDMKQLRAQGFMLDTETKRYVSEVIHDMYQLTKDDFTYRKNSGQLEYSVLGEGDTAKGKQIYAEYYKAYQEQLKYWQDLYKNKLYSTDLNQGMQQYNRYNTTYLQDKNGNWYATGFKQGLGGMLSPLTYAPNESGAENDWASISAVTGQPMFDMNGNVMRGMVAVDNTSTNTPTLASWGTESNNGYSSSYSGSSSYGSSSSKRSYSSGSSGSSRSTSIHSTTPSLNIGNVPTPRASTYKDAQFDYLRPNYQVAGSTKATRKDYL